MIGCICSWFGWVFLDVLEMESEHKLLAMVASVAFGAPGLIGVALAFNGAGADSSLQARVERIEAALKANGIEIPPEGK